MPIKATLDDEDVVADEEEGGGEDSDDGYGYDWETCVGGGMRICGGLADEKRRRRRWVLGSHASNHGVHIQ